MKLRNKKTGEIGEAYWTTFREGRTDLCISLHVNGTYEEVHSLAELNEDWEDYEPAEPLIKDEEIRRAVRGLGFTKVCFVSPSGLTWRAYDYEFNSAFELIIKTKPFDECKDGNVYHITDLCGEEEE